MSSAIWTQSAVASEAKRCSLALWRAVEAQHIVATRALVDDLAEHEVLEELLDDSKPPMPEACERLDYLLATPFRYPPTGYGSRFRSLTDPGVWYGAEDKRTSCAELGYWRWRFVVSSEGLKRLDAVAHTIFQAAIKGSAVDLRAAPFLRDRPAWTDPDDYGRCQAFARIVRAASVQVVRYESVRDPQHAGCAAVLDCVAFAKRDVRRQETWFLTVDNRGATWLRSGGRKAASFDFAFEDSGR
jgi:RES domain